MTIKEENFLDVQIFVTACIYAAMKILSFSFSVLLFLLTLPVSASSQAPLKVGALIPFAGRGGNSGRECAKGMLDASRWLNQRGGVFGMKLEIFLIEDTSEPAEIVAAFRRLNEADQVLLLYIYSMKTALDLLPHVHFNRLPTLGSTFTSHLANPSKYPYIFSINPTSLDLLKIAIKFTSERAGIATRKPKTVFVGSPEFLNRYFLDEAKEYARGTGLDVGPDIVIPHLSAPANVTAQNLFSALSTLNSYNPDFAYLSLPSKEASYVLREAKETRLRNKWICNMKAFDENLGAFEGVMGVQPVSPFGEDVPGMAGITEAHQKWHPYDSHTVSYVEGWATVQVIAEALGRSLPEQGFSRERIKLALESFRDFVVGGLVPPLTITLSDHRPSVESRIFIIKDGKLVRHTPFISVGR
jgi:ABC-type branched-subunit amino acid transport system substrate-binding protein